MSDASPVADLSVHTPRRPRLRFTLSGMFVFTLGVALALAYRQVPNVRLGETILVACVCWISVGMLQEARSLWLIWRAKDRLPKDIEFGFFVQIGQRLAVIGMLGIGGALDIHRQFGSKPLDEYPYSWALEGVSSSLFFLGTICAYGARPTASLPGFARWRRAAYDLAAFVLGILWLCYILFSVMTLTGIVHIAIRGVEVTQPTRWMNEPIYPANLHPEVTRRFIHGSFWAAALVAVASLCTAQLAWWWRLRRPRFVLLIAATTSLIAAGYLIHWCWTIGYPTLSPFFAEYHGQPPLANWIAGCVLLVAGALTFATWVVSENLDERAVQKVPAQTTPLHRKSAVIVLLLMGAIAGIEPPEWSSSWWEVLWELFAALPSFPFFNILQAIAYKMEQPAFLMRLAAILVVAGHFWRRRAIDSSEASYLRSINPEKFGAVSLLTLAVLSFGVAACAWLGFVLFVYGPKIGL